MPDRYVIWSDLFEDVSKYAKELGKEIDPMDEMTDDALFYMAEDEIYENLENEIEILSQLKPKHSIVIVSTVGRWDGTHYGYQVVDWDDMSEALKNYPRDCESRAYTVEFVGDEHKFLMTGRHHDGSYEFEYREATDDDQEYESEADLMARTRPLGDDVGALYFPF